MMADGSLWIALRGNTAAGPGGQPADITDILTVPGGMIVRNYSHGIMAMAFVKVDSDGLDAWIENHREQPTFLPR